MRFSRNLRVTRDDDDNDSDNDDDGGTLKKFTVIRECTATLYVSWFPEQLYTRVYYSSALF